MLATKAWFRTPTSLLQLGRTDQVNRTIGTDDGDDVQMSTKAQLLMTQRTMMA